MLSHSLSRRCGRGLADDVMHMSASHADLVCDVTGTDCQRQIGNAGMCFYDFHKLGHKLMLKNAVFYLKCLPH